MDKKRKRRSTKIYLLLDIEDILNVRGKLTRQELIRMLKIRDSMFETWLTNKGILDNKYYVVEDM